MFVFSRDLGSCAEAQSTQVIKEKNRVTGKITTELSIVSKGSGDRCTQGILSLIINFLESSWFGNFFLEGI